MTKAATLGRHAADLLKPAPAVPRPWRAGYWDEQERRFVKARPEQLAPDGYWYIWLMLAGRGWGKTRTGAEWILEQAMQHPNTEWAIIGKTIGQARDVCVENKQSGLLKCALPGEVKRYVANPCQIDFRNGARIYALGSEDADRLRGYNLAGAWCDELSTWPYQATWQEGLIPAIRAINVTPHIVVTTTPKPKPLIKMLLARDETTTRVVRGSTYDNIENLAPSFIDEMHATYDNTRLGRQEINGELLDDVEGALWSWQMLEESRVDQAPDRLARVVVGVDPAVSNTSTSDETGIVAVGMTGSGATAEFYVLDDRSMKGSPQQWATAVVACYTRWSADRVVGEVNNGGDLVEHTLRTIQANLPIRKVHASRGKRIRAEPVVALYEQGRVHHVGSYPVLEDQMTSWDSADPGAKSPDRVDALVWAVTVLSEGRARMVVYDTPRRSVA